MLGIFAPFMIDRISIEAHKAVIAVDKIVAHIREIGHNKVQDICGAALEAIAINQGDAEAGIY
jgi:hypothetical protein